MCSLFSYYVFIPFKLPIRLSLSFMISSYFNLLCLITAPPKFESKFVSHTVPKGKDSELKCEAEGELPMRFEWEKDKQHLDASTMKR